ncbi:MAG: hypothetical protein J2O48_08880, partial [Solirubrobacterales bacterium]|nr:hypothetical protein [Solirubrobacterales bacterium]
AAQGQQIMVASGDTGALGCSGSGRPQADSISSESEAAPPWITGVGGTDLSQASTTPGSKVHREVAWNDGSGSGAGGQSVAWAMPAWQRQYLKASKVAPKGAADPCHVSRALGCRMEPDIALDADGEEGGAEAAQMLAPPGPNPPDFRNVHDVGSPGYADYCATPNCGGSGWEPVGGTSAAAPLAASAAVLWDQEARSQGLKSIGFLNPALYQLASDPSTYARDFHDVTAGSNNVHYDTKDCPRGCNPHGLYQAGRGYDMATGLGSFDVTALGNDLVKNARGLDLSPNTQTLYGYSNGGPATSRAVSVTGGSAGAGYSAHSDAKWLQVRGGKVDGRLHWRADPRGLKPGNYTGHISVKSGASSATLTVHYQVTPKARISLLSHSLHFAEKAIGGKTCTPVWGDELQSTSKSMITIAQKSGRPSKQALLAMTRQALRVANRGARGSVLHLAIDQISQGWLVNDEAPPHKKRQDVPGQPLVPSVVSVPGGGQASVPLASVANGNLEVEEAPMPPGTYTAKLRVRDLANPSSVAYVKATLVLGNGKGTPEIGSAPLKLAARADTTRHSQLVLTDPHASCAYQFSAAGNAGWVTVGNSLTDGTVGVHSHVRVPISINTRGMKPGVHHSSITVQSVNAGNGGVRVPVSVRVLPAKR